MDPAHETPSDFDRLAPVVRALARYRSRLARKLEGLRGDLAEAERAAEYRRHGETLLTYIRQVPPRASLAVLPDLADPAGNVEIALDPALKPQDNAARYFKRAAKGERGLKQIPSRLAAVEAELRALDHLLERSTRAEEYAPLPEGGSIAHVLQDRTLEHDLEEALERLPPTLRRNAGPSAPASRAGKATAGPARGEPRGVPARLQPRRLKSKEGWEVMIGRSNDGNDYLTHQLARPEDYWLHVHGAAGSHVVLRRGKGKNEPSKRSIEEVAAWAAFYSQARTAGKVPVIVTRKKYVRKPRKAPPGLAVCEREKTVMVRPQEPPRSALASEQDSDTASGAQ